MSTIDYSTWDHIEVSDDEDVIHPNVDTASLFRMRHRARLERMAEFQQRGEELEYNQSECRRQIEETQGRVKQLEEEDKLERGDEEKTAELSEARAELKKLRKDERSSEKMMQEYRKEEKGKPWNVDTISKEGFSKSVLNIKPEPREETEEEKEHKHETFVVKNEKQITHFGLLRRWDDSQKYLSDNPHLVCEETANYLVVMCIDLEIDEKHALMEQVAHQAIVIQFILELAKSLKVDPRGCFRMFFAKIKTADKPYQDAFDDELESFKDRIRRRAEARMENAMTELEEEERQKRLGPGGLDPVEVYQTLPEGVQKCFDDKDLERLQVAMSMLDPTEAKFHLRRCIDSGLWVPFSGEGEEEDDEGGEELNEGESTEEH